MDERTAALIAEGWSGGAGLVPRGPTWVLDFAPADTRDVERHAGRRPDRSADIWRICVGGRFLRSGGLVYPGGVPFPDELARETPTVSSEVWLYVDASAGRVLGVHSWPEAVRKPVASTPRDDFPASSVANVEDAQRRLELTLRVPHHAKWTPELVVCTSRTSAIVLCLAGTVPDPLNEMLLYEQGGLALRVSSGRRPDLGALLREHQPPYRRTRVGSADAAGREPGRALGPQTWPWPGELLWWEGGVRYELKGACPLSVLDEVARTV